MQFGYEVTIPKNTPISQPIKVRNEIDSFILTEIYIDIPNGCLGLVGLQIYALGRLIFPRNAEYWFKGNDVQKAFMCFWSIEDTPHDLEIHAYNLDDTYDHTIQVVFTFNMTQSGSLISGGIGSGSSLGSGESSYTPPSPYEPYDPNAPYNEDEEEASHHVDNDVPISTTAFNSFMLFSEP